MPIEKYSTGPTLAEMLAAVINHPDLPPLLYESIARGINDMYNSLNDAGRKIDSTVPYIDLLLRVYAEQERGES